jgi:hypothetical protein
MTIAMPCLAGSTNCITKTQGHPYGVLSGVSTGTGYDLATGLGSVDVFSLVNNWNTVTFNPSTITLTLNSGGPVNVQHGTALPVGITLNPTAATGDVALLVGPGTPGTPGIEQFKLVNGAVNGTTSRLPGGTYSVIAHYDGDTNYGGSYSNSVPVKVNPEGSKTFPNLEVIDINGNPVSFAATTATYGAGYFQLRVDVGDSGASVGTATGISSGCSRGVSSCPTGTATLAAAGTPLNGITLPLNGAGYVEYPLSPGSYSVSASYPGDASYGASAGTAQFTVAKAPTTATAAVPGTPVEYGNFTQIVGAIATTSDGIAPTGTFQFLVDGSSIGSPVSVYENGPYMPNSNPPYAWADASSSTEFLSVGAHTLAVQYSGDERYASSTSFPTNVSVAKAQAFFNSWGWTTFGQPVAVGQTVNTTAQLFGSTSGAAPTGAFTFYDNNAPIAGTVTYTPSTSPAILRATLPYTFTTPGTHSLTVKYPGDTNYLSAAVPVPQVVNVLGPVSVTAAGPVNIASPGLPGSTTRSVTPNKGFAGTVSLSCSPDPAGLDLCFQR